MSNIELYWTDKDNNNTNITKLCSNISWEESADSHVMKLTFSLPDTNEKYIEHYMIEAGDKIRLLHDNSLFYVFVVEEVERSYPNRNVTAVDFAYYIENNDVTIQFINMGASDCIIKLCNTLGIGIDEICDMPKVINKVYIDGASDVIEDIIKQQAQSDGKEYDYEMNGPKLKVYRLWDDVGIYKHKPADNLAEFDVTEQHSRITYKHSINGMKNSVRAYINSDTDGHLPAIEYVLQDQDNARRYGKLQANFAVQADDQSRIGELAKNELEDKDKLHREISCVMIGNISARKNRVMYIEDEYTGLKCKVRIASVKHTINSGVWSMELTFNTLKSDELSNLASQKIHREDVNIGGEDALDNKNKRPTYDKIWNCAKNYIGVPYIMGGYSPKGFDCSGFVCYVLNKSGAWKCGRLTAQGLYNKTKRVKSPVPGDLIFWTGTYKTSSYITHVGICIGNGKNIQAGGTKVQISSNKGAVAYGRF